MPTSVVGACRLFPHGAFQDLNGHVLQRPCHVPLFARLVLAILVHLHGEVDGDWIFDYWNGTFWVVSRQLGSIGA